MTDLNEPILDDDYRVYAGFLYAGDGEVFESDVTGTVAKLKQAHNIKEVRRCDIFGRHRRVERENRADKS